MGGLEDLRPVKVPDGTLELRIHGVSGTPPESLLKDGAFAVRLGTVTGFFRRKDERTAKPGEDGPGIVEAYSWGGLTSGSRYLSALRLLLLPFALMNVAGWMMPGVRDDADGAPTAPAAGGGGTRDIIHTLAARLIALALTAYAVLGAQWLCALALTSLPARFGWADVAPGWRDPICLSVAIVAMAAWAWIARRRQMSHLLARFDDPEGGETYGATARDALVRTPPAAPQRAGLGTWALWSAAPVVRHLSWIHTTTGAGALLTLYATSHGEGAAATTARIIGWTMLGGGLAWMLAFSAFGRLVPDAWRTAVGRATWGVTIVATVAVGVLAGGTATEGATAAFQRVLVIIVGAVVVLLLVEMVAAPRHGPWRGRLFAGAFQVVAFGTAITAVSGGGVFLAKVLAPPGTGVAPTAFTSTLAVLGFGAVLVTLAAVLAQWPVLRRLSSPAWFMRLRAVAARARGVIMTGAAAFAVGGVVIAVLGNVAIGGTDAFPPPVRGGELAWTAAGWILVAVVVGALASGLAPANRAGVAVAVVVGAVFAGGTWWILGDQADERFTQLAVWVAFLAPIGWVLTFMRSGSSDGGARRQVGVVWDLVSLWPRAFHPWSPAPYTDTTIPELVDRIGELAKAGGARHIVVSAHSQGAIFSVPVVERILRRPPSGAKPASLPETTTVSLLTYGQLLDVHYRWLFPRIYNPVRFTELRASLTGDAAADGTPRPARWLNLYRLTDPLGHPIGCLGELNIENKPTADPEGPEPYVLETDGRRITMQHSDYQYGAAYQAALKELDARSRVP
ncbi:hypothetical protein QQX09_01675 [Demequina sp. SYSU T00192]|uniref:Integral membrane protein n=1 Tax=Demequina litoralis TaxID=3051660 RepID=A0ABT8G5Y5_9MICO|nr:hypothetical protein [Demequina sp. SYSU T00192]MDN4474555.1 hypothetical protein [Demequina sp. SYSU T00192]